MGIGERRAEAEQGIRDAEGELEIAQARLRAVQKSCAHPNLQKWVKRDYGGGSDTHEQCDDCGYHRTI